MSEQNTLVQYEGGEALTPIMDLTVAKARLAEFQKFVKEYLVEGDGQDYGTIPGTPKPTLFKSGADKLCELYGLADTYEIIDKIIDYTQGLFDYEIRCTLTSRRDGRVVATGLGCCSSYEGKYRWRDQKQRCPKCHNETIFRSKDKNEYFCWAKKGGCSATFPFGDSAIEDQIIGRVENEDVATLKNTILKMAKKRAKVDATLSATRSSGLFTQDVGDDEETDKPKGAGNNQRGKAPSTPQRKSEGAANGGSSGNGGSEVVVSEPQRKRLYGISKDRGMSDEELKEIIVAAGYASSKDILRSDYDEICKAVQTWSAVEHKNIVAIITAAKAKEAVPV